ncbi:O-antigen polymerase [Vibrio cholerae]|nr:hypothetical protein VCSRO11_3501 [Vibrio cholerae]GIB93455.1 hypothetical protein VCSRO190_2751 [Vibrio cholerae]
MANLIDPLGLFKIKYFAFAILFISVVVVFNQSILLTQRFKIYFSLYFIIYLPFYGLMMMLIASDMQIFRLNDTSYILSSFIITFILLLYNEELVKKNQKIMLFSLYCLVVLTYLVALNDLLGIEQFVAYFVGQGLLYYSTRTYSHIEFPYVYFIISPMLLLLLTRNFWFFLIKPGYVKFLSVVIVGVSIFLSGTRMNILMIFIALLITMTYFYRNKLTLRVLFTYLISLLLAIISAFIIVYMYSDVISAAFSINDISNSKKFHDFLILLEIYDNPFFLIFGQGFNAYDWSVLSREMIAENATKIELTYFEFIRVFGLVNFMLLFFFFSYALIFMPIGNMEFGWVKPALVSYLLVSFFNPYLFSLNGMLAVGTCLSVIFIRKSDIKG